VLDEVKAPLGVERTGTYSFKAANSELVKALDTSTCSTDFPAKAAAESTLLVLKFPNGE
jgi:hypothetical protein